MKPKATPEGVAFSFGLQNFYMPAYPIHALKQSLVRDSAPNFVHWYPGKAYFPKTRRSKYHQHLAISLPSSEWDRVVRAKLNHREAATRNFVRGGRSGCAQPGKTPTTKIL